MKKYVLCILTLFLMVVSSWAETEPIYEHVADSYSPGAALYTFVDIDNDNDVDFFGSGFSYPYVNISHYRNDGTPENAEWSFITSEYNSMAFFVVATPAFVDIDSDGDLDLFVGDKDGYISFYRNDGDKHLPAWTFITDRYGWIQTRCEGGWGCYGGHASPTFVDIDNDGDYDLFVGGWLGDVSFYRNDGTPQSASWTRDDSLSLQLGTRAVPALADIDRDGDYDLFVGSQSGLIAYYKNTGTAEFPQFTFVTSSFKGINAGFYSFPSFVDIDKDDDLDLFVGSYWGLHLYKNIGNTQVPVANAGLNITVELQSCAGSTITLDGTGSYDPDGDTLTYIWNWSGGTAEGMNPIITLPLGTTTLTLTVADDKGSISTDTVSITVTDTTTPGLEVTATPNILWPPNHNYINIMPNITAVDNCIDTTKVQLLSITSNEPDNGEDDGNATNDILINNNSIQLRAERSGSGTGRVYTINYMATDGSGNTSTAAAQVIVPLSVSK